MGSYWSKKGDKTGQEAESTDGEEKQQKSKYKIVYTDKPMKVSEYPLNMRSIFVLRRIGSMFVDEDGDLAHEFYREKRVKNKRGVVRWIMERISETRLVPQGEVRHQFPRLQTDFPLVLLDSNAIILPR